MNKAMWIAMTGLEAQQTRMSVISNNLANVNTMGFKRDRAVFRRPAVSNGTAAGCAILAGHATTLGFDDRYGVRTVATEKLHTQGNIVQTNNSLDVAIQGRGFIQVQMPDGSLAYTRDGAFQIDSTGQLVTASGYLIDPALTIPDDAQSVTIGSDGTVSVAVQGQAQPSQIGTLQVGGFRQLIRPAAYRSKPVRRDRLQWFAEHG